jgi:hypothetical protein
MRAHGQLQTGLSSRHAHVCARCGFHVRWGALRRPQSDASFSCPTFAPLLHPLRPYPSSKPGEVTVGGQSDYQDLLSCTSYVRGLAAKAFRRRLRAPPESQKSTLDPAARLQPSHVGAQPRGKLARHSKPMVRQVFHGGPLLGARQAVARVLVFGQVVRVGPATSGALSPPRSFRYPRHALAPQSTPLPPLPLILTAAAKAGHVEHA